MLACSEEQASLTADQAGTCNLPLAALRSRRLLRVSQLHLRLRSAGENLSESVQRCTKALGIDLGDGAIRVDDPDGLRLSEFAELGGLLCICSCTPGEAALTAGPKIKKARWSVSKAVLWQLGPTCSATFGIDDTRPACLSHLIPCMIMT